jgi:hypothetical protein
MLVTYPFCIGAHDAMCLPVFKRSVSLEHCVSRADGISLQFIIRPPSSLDHGQIR